MNSIEISKKTIIEYLVIRGYQLAQQKAEGGFQIKGFYSNILLFTAKDSTEGKTTLCDLLVLWTEKVGKEELRSLISSMYWNEFNFILIYNDKVTNECLKDITILNDSKRKIELFGSSELQYNIFDNILVPSVEVLNRKDKFLLIQNYESSKLPKILLSDPVCRYLGCQKGDILKFSRDRNTPYYRIVRS